MFKLNALEKMTTEQKYAYALMMLEGQISSEKDIIANLANASAIVKVVMDRLNWAGFYLMRDGELVLGPFQGLPACNRIKLSAGVCGAAARERKTQLVPNVHEFPGHIACDVASNAELVVPIIKDGVVYGVLDLDSPEIGRFGELEAKYMEKFVAKLVAGMDWQ
ncbi:MAG TPA: GAF domain-containing protein [Selenomonadales bacterium]|nr:GAF domain-containing protein [Selenomonadales bacterium]